MLAASKGQLSIDFSVELVATGVQQACHILWRPDDDVNSDENSPPRSKRSLSQRCLIKPFNPRDHRHPSSCSVLQTTVTVVCLIDCVGFSLSLSLGLAISIVHELQCYIWPYLPPSTVYINERPSVCLFVCHVYTPKPFIRLRCSFRGIVVHAPGKVYHIGWSIWEHGNRVGDRRRPVPISVAPYCNETLHNHCAYVCEGEFIEIPAFEFICGT